jgi:hypothetical protein
MLGLLTITAFGLVTALLLGGSFAGWRHVRVRWLLPAFVALAVQLVVYNPPFDSQPWAMTWGPWLFVASKAIVVAVLAANAFAAGPFRAAWLIAAVGVAMNLAVIAANGGYMPQSSEARVASRGATLNESESAPRLLNVKPVDESTHLVWLGDVVPQPAWFPRSNVISIGDLLLAVGLGMWAFQVTMLVRRAPAQRLQPADI